VKISYRQAASDDGSAAVSVLPRYPKSPRHCGSLPGRRQAYRRVVARASVCGSALWFEQSATSESASCPVAGFEAIRIYYLLDEDAIRVIRILHGMRDVKRILEREAGA